MANKEKARKLPMRMVKADYDKYKEVVSIDFEEDGRVYSVKLYPYFEPIRINNLIKRLGEDMKEINEHKKLVFPDELIPLFVLYHILIEFSDFPTPKTDNIERKVSYFIKAINTKYFKDVVDHLIQDEVDKVWNNIMDTLAVHEKLKRAEDKFKNKIEKLNLQSPEVREHVEKNFLNK